MLNQRDKTIIEEVSQYQDRFVETYDGAELIKGFRQVNQLLSIITRLEKALEKCKEQRDFHADCRFKELGYNAAIESDDEQLRNILDGKDEVTK